MIFRLRLDEYRKGWVSTYYDVHADDIDTAVSYLLNDDPDHCEKVKDEKHRSELLLPSENMGEPTCKVVNYFGGILWDNSTSEKRYRKLAQAEAKKLVGYEGFDEHVFKGTPMDDGDKNVYFADEEWLDGKL